jgi:hypothetical protein
MIRIALSVFVVVLAATATVINQPVPTPGPEHKKLSVLVGTWTTEGTVSANPLIPEAKWSAKIASSWYDGQFAVIRHVEGVSSTLGKIRSIDIIAYDREAKNYTWYGIDSTGDTGMGRVSIEGDVLISYWDANVKGKPYKLRGTLKGLGSDNLTWVTEYSEDSKTWTPYFRSTDVRVKGR